MSILNVKEQFVHHYQSQNYEVLPCGSLLDPATPMTFVGSAGLTQIENDIAQGEDHAGERYVLVQTCFRHFDLNKVGQDPVHLSLFGMGGAFAFGQVSRQDTLSKIWDFLTDKLALPQERIWATYFGGGTLDGHTFPENTETYKTWHGLGLVSPHIVAVDIDTGFWKQGGGLAGEARFRKCGPTTELFFDRDPTMRCGPQCQPGCPCGRFVEIANILFLHSQLDQVTKKSLPMVTPFDETVIGVERVAMIHQKKNSVFELEYFQPLMQLINAYAPPQAEVSAGQKLRSVRVIADHTRALLFLTADGAPPPGKGGRQRIMRLLVRGIITRQKILEITDEAFFSTVLDATLMLYKAQFRDPKQVRGRLLGYFREESEKFEATLLRGYRRLERCISIEEEEAVSGKQALDLVKAYGFPLPLLKVTLAKRGIPFDKRGYGKAYVRWRREVVNV